MSAETARTADARRMVGWIYGRHIAHLGGWQQPPVCRMDNDDKRRPPRDPRTEELIEAFERERDAARDLSRRHAENTRDSHDRDRQVIIERRRKPR